MKIFTNNKPRELFTFDQLTEKESANFSYDNAKDSTFFRYRDYVYDISDFMSAPPDLKAKGWHCYACDSYFSGTLIKMIDDDNIVVARYSC